jgi:prepilin-type processing-associated H-X9-DG protein
VGVSLESFVCPSSSQVAYDGQNSNASNPDIVDLWDFGSVDFQNTGPRNCVSYSYHLPYSNYPAGVSGSSFAVMADKNPWYDSQIRKGEATDYDWKQRVAYIVWNDSIRGDRDWQLEVGNAQTHLRDGQNVSYGDGHVSWESRSDVGITHDNIYTTQIDSTSDGVRIGTIPDPHEIGSGQPLNASDSFLVNDDLINPCYADQPGDLNKDCTVDVGDLAILSKYWMESTNVD